MLAKSGPTCRVSIQPASQELQDLLPWISCITTLAFCARDCWVFTYFYSKEVDRGVCVCGWERVHVRARVRGCVRDAAMPACSSLHHERLYVAKQVQNEVSMMSTASHGGAVSQDVLNLLAAAALLVRSAHIREAMPRVSLVTHCSRALEQCTCLPGAPGAQLAALKVSWHIVNAEGLCANNCGDKDICFQACC